MSSHTLLGMWLLIHAKPSVCSCHHFTFQPTVLLGEPFFSASVVPWHNIHFWYARSALSDLLPEKPSIVPCCATMRAIGVEFDHLWKIRAPVGNCEGFKLDTFDRIIEVKLEFVDQSSTRIPPPRPQKFKQPVSPWLLTYQHTLSY